MSFITAARLVADGLDEFVLLPRDDWRMSDLDIATPSPRRVENPRAGADGVDDETRFHGPSEVTFAGAVVDGWGTVDRLASFCRPDLRPFLYFSVDGASERRMRLSYESLSRPLTAGEPGLVRVQVQWRAPDGVAESVDEQVQLVNPAGDEDGRSYDLSFDRSWPESQGRGRVEIVNEGSATAYPVFRIYGPLTDPLVENETSGRQLSFDLEVSQGDYLEVDTANRTIRLNGLEVNNRYDTLDFPTSQWFGLRPGVNLIRFAPETSSAPAVCEVRWRGAWL